MKCIVCEKPLENPLFGEIGGLRVSLCEKHFSECSNCQRRKFCNIHNRMCDHE
ncbi:MAG: hypothetical protein HZB67_02035 [Candidatus Aenigmarchaeota archaeon]|nr:hypothetical protein [Candidatus Aenigmarchaeota archaeon]